MDESTEKKRFRGRVLTVDDSVIYTKIYQKRLKDEDIDVIVYNKPLEMIKNIAQLKKQDIDLIMLDEEMPGIQGHELLKIIDQEFNLPIVFISTRTDLRKDILALSRNVLTFIHKDELKEFDAKILPWIIHGISRSRLQKKVLSPKTVGIVGMGRVGLEIAQLLVATGSCERIFLKSFREDKNKDEGKVLDLKESAASFPHVSIELVDYPDLFYTDIVIICLGIPQEVGESRDALLLKNNEIIKQVATNLIDINPEGLYLVITNPLDPMTQSFAHYSKMNKNRVIGTGCILENIRMINEIAKEIKINPKEVDCQMIGPHGDLSTPVYGHTFVSGVPVSQYLDFHRYYAIFENIRKSAYKIIEAQGASYRGIAAVTVSLINDLYKEYPSIWPISRYISRFPRDGRIKDVYLGYPSIVSLKYGVSELSNMTLSDYEHQKFYNSFLHTKEQLKTIGLA